MRLFGGCNTPTPVLTRLSTCIALNSTRQTDMTRPWLSASRTSRHNGSGFVTCGFFTQLIALLYPWGRSGVILLWSNIVLCLTYTLEAALLLASRAHLFANNLIDFNVLCDASVDADALSLIEVALAVSLIDAFVVARAAILDMGRVVSVSETGNQSQQIRHTRPCG